MDPTIAFPGAIPRPRPTATTGVAGRHARRARHLAAAIALAIAVLGAVAGGVIDGAAGEDPAGPVPPPPGPVIVP